MSEIDREYEIGFNILASEIADKETEHAKVQRALIVACILLKAIEHIVIEMESGIVTGNVDRAAFDDNMAVIADGFRRTTVNVDGTRYLHSFTVRNEQVGYCVQIVINRVEGSENED